MISEMRKSSHLVSSPRTCEKQKLEVRASGSRGRALAPLESWACAAELTEDVKRERMLGESAELIKM